jgi:hypothetical protein
MQRIPGSALAIREDPYPPSRGARTTSPARADILGLLVAVVVFGYLLDALMRGERLWMTWVR